MEYELINEALALLVSLFGDNVGAWVVNALLYVSTIAGAASLVVLALEKIAGITPSTKDDYYVGKAKKFLGKVTAVLDKIALNPAKHNAREK